VPSALAPHFVVGTRIFGAGLAPIGAGVAGEPPQTELHQKRNGGDDASFCGFCSPSY